MLPSKGFHSGAPFKQKFKSAGPPYAAGWSVAVAAEAAAALPLIKSSNIK